jgi:hypothetical protein
LRLSGLGESKKTGGCAAFQIFGGGFESKASGVVVLKRVGRGSVKVCCEGGCGTVSTLGYCDDVIDLVDWDYTLTGAFGLYISLTTGVLGSRDGGLGKG